MCVLALAFAAHPRWRMVAIANRDEFHARDAAALAAWDDPAGLIAGRDLQSGGTWLGVSQTGCFAAVTNLVNPAGPDPDKVSRGALVTDTLLRAGHYANPSADDLDDFNPVNLIAVGPDGAEFMTNRPTPKRRNLAPGIYGLANGPLDEPWPKTMRIKAMLADWMEADSGDFNALLDGLRTDDAPQVPPGQARQSPIFILNPAYGTRCSTVVVVDDAGKGMIAERRYDVKGEVTGQTDMRFDWGSDSVT